MYLTVNTLHFHDKNRPFNATYGNNLFFVRKVCCFKSTLCRQSVGGVCVVQ